MNCKEIDSETSIERSKKVFREATLLWCFQIWLCVDIKLHGEFQQLKQKRVSDKLGVMFEDSEYKFPLFFRTPFILHHIIEV